MRVLGTWGLGVGAAVALCATATVAVAEAPLPSYPECTKKPTPADVEGAKGAHKAASQFYERGEYEKAIRYWNDAYAFDCTANDLLVNIANAYERLGDRVATVTTLEIYLSRTPPNPTLAQKVKNLKLLIAAAQPSVPPTASAAPTASGAPTASATPPASDARPYGVKPWILVGTGAALAVVGAVLLPLGYGAISDAEAVCPNHTCPPGTVVPGGGNLQEILDKGNSGRVQAGVGWTMMSLGIAAVGGGMVWQLLYNKPHAGKPTAAPTKTGFWMSPVAGPGTAGMSLGGTF